MGAKYKFRVPLRPNERSDTSMKRNKEIKIRFTNDELSLLNSYVSKAGYTSREKYIRAVLLESVPKEQPSIDYQKLINEFNSIGNNLNQLVKLSYYHPLIEQDALLVLAQLKSLISSTELVVRGVS
ncbi:plasmid mobilization protein [Thomasclavelia ramosa]|uniref:plasmid mobilization protein n=1 Tax=Thomasclavelia ramosa TaxID=1547 RepID=UPI002279CB60|nr:MbeCy [Thomasclavelia ramosa]